ncbi:MAG: rhomboid family intramembrane serine protease [Cohaesibacteraceae bacterium]|nr:rhomboid family intramembrane serine protease [Cohaesibacteraceae bacterium]MBL4876252.1 rhomboid family intramembrane serine protease [Cohaesibacteraceae bacterium]
MFIPLYDHNPLQHIKRQYMVITIICVNVLVHLLSATLPVDALRAVHVFYGATPTILDSSDGTILSLLTYSFLHADWMHLLGNMLFLWVFGDNVEDATGHWKFLAFYCLVAISGGIAHWISADQSYLIGASGATSGIVAAYLVLHPRVKIWVLILMRIPLKLSAIWCLGAWILFQIGMTLISSGDNVAWAVHVAGIVAGVILIPLFKRPEVKLFDTSPDGTVKKPSDRDKA